VRQRGSDARQLRRLQQRPAASTWQCGPALFQVVGGDGDNSPEELVLLATADCSIRIVQFADWIE